VRIEPEDPERDWTSTGVYEIQPDLYRIPLPLPTDGLKAVNVYAMRDGDGLVLVDSGWSIDDARAVLDKAVGALGHTLGDVHHFLITHVHRDHYTLAVRVRSEFGNRVSLGIGEQTSLRQSARPGRRPWTAMTTKLRHNGAHQLADMIASNPVSNNPDDWKEPDEWLTAPSDVVLRDRSLQAIPTPGHTQGHLVFVDGARDVMFAGDHVLPHITPSIGLESTVAASPLGDFLASLRLVRGMPDRVMLPAHGPVSPSIHNRVDELLEHHDHRLDAIATTVERGAHTGWEVANQLAWTRREKALTDLDEFNQCLAVCETGIHLDLLAEQGRVTRTEVDGVRHYQV
jgi:glyoxylase-like metal-dependent hydrolase (beta-lactamase superfamily II)